MNKGHPKPKKSFISCCALMFNTGILLFITFISLWIYHTQITPRSPDLKAFKSLLKQSRDHSIPNPSEYNLNLDLNLESEVQLMTELTKIGIPEISKLQVKLPKSGYISRELRYFLHLSFPQSVKYVEVIGNDQYPALGPILDMLKPNSGKIKEKVYFEGFTVTQDDFGHTLEYFSHIVQGPTFWNSRVTEYTPSFAVSPDFEIGFRTIYFWKAEGFSETLLGHMARGLAQNASIRTKLTRLSMHRTGISAKTIKSIFKQNGLKIFNVRSDLI